MHMPLRYLTAKLAQQVRLPLLHVLRGFELERSDDF